MRKFVALVLVGCSALAAAQNLSPEVRAFVKVDAPLVALTHLRVIDGTGAPAREDQTVVISKGKIESVGDLSRLRSNFIAGIKHLPVRFADVREPAAV